MLCSCLGTYSYALSLSSLGRDQLGNGKRAVCASTWKVPELKAVASQHLFLEVLSAAQQRCGYDLLQPPNAMVTLSHSRSAQLPNSKRPPLLPT